MDNTTRHRNKHAVAWIEIKSMLGEEVVVRSTKDGTIKWRLVESVIDDNMIVIIETEQKYHDKKVGINKGEHLTLSSVFWKSWPIEVKSNKIK